MVDRVDFRILGPLEVAVGGHRAAVPAGKQRVLLAGLLLRSNEVVPVEDLVEWLWGEGTPRCPRGALQTQVARLRRWLAQFAAGAPQAAVPQAALHASAAGYLIEVEPGRLDLARFRDLIDAAAGAAGRGDLEAESVLLGAALAQWRGPALPDVRSDALHRDAVPRLTEEWLRAVERRGEAALLLGRHQEVVGELRFLTGSRPFHERFWYQLMLALYRCGRQAEALAAYRDVRARLDEQLGISPGQELRALHEAILRNDPALDRSAALVG
ncbi:BTAD domain-containing putative transcriptional regulator [Actinomadura sp. 21ATH]|uniref:AfsR/SARP family transcriptional regulator n=1 Tax=Actinomadura sp. 21ATH TaxID=1735444 RepID=UPI0035C239EE